MLKSILKEYSALQAILESRNEIEKLPGPENLLADFITFLEPFKNATDDLSASLTPTMHQVVPIFKELKAHCQVRDSEQTFWCRVLQIFHMTCRLAGLF
jgi:hypothetical protein